MTQSRTEIGTLGEFGLIRRLSEGFQPALPDTIKGIGDDAAVMDQGQEYGLITTDMLVEGVHFDLAFSPLRHLGYKAISVNVSDIAAMNGVPRQVVVGLGLSNRFSVEAVEELYAGIKAACEDFNVDLVGGDTTSSRSGLIISVTVFGKVAREKVAYRNTARPNDILCVTGDLGSAYMGLQLLEREKQVFMANPNMQPELEGKEYVVQRQLKPEARMDVIYELEEAGVVPTSMIDVSDGLASEILHICSQSKVGAIIVEENLPIDEQTFLVGTELNLDPVTAAMNGGEDYELLFTIRQDDYNKVKNNPKISFIGYITDKTDEVILSTKGGNRYPITAQGWNHFS
ncbi:thiamine-phosphate kinase [Telluribacter sp. SYSU D00476]|uniref:thiamine-phosphate kinase n=1 Tax=Telluribacter sp. SYSU D00476 TaxID=2811430 RepID=UPI001FF41D0B|nr:thiamine-phosphate kinase [Telluribacter sp. SYSU D00476]